VLRSLKVGRPAGDGRVGYAIYEVRITVTI